MTTYQGKPKKHGRYSHFRAWLVIGVLTVLIIILSRSVWGIYQKNKLADENKEMTVRTLNELKQRQTEAETKLNRLQTTQGVEEEIRKTLPVAKDGEHVITIIDQSDEATDTASGTSSSRFWTALLHNF